MNGTISTTVAVNGFEGVLYSGDGTKNRVMIVMSGSNGGMKLTKAEALFYHKNGIPALALALFKTKQTGKFLDRVPVEYVENAIKWLKEQGYQNIGIDGMSKGSEMALLSASMFSEISCVIARVPSYYDLFRVENGFIAEHWDVMETLADKDTWQNQNGKF